MKDIFLTRQILKSLLTMCQIIKKNYVYLIISVYFEYLID